MSHGRSCAIFAKRSIRESRSAVAVTSEIESTSPAIDASAIVTATSPFFVAFELSERSKEAKRFNGLLQFFADAPAALIGMKACPSSHWLARKLTGFGHTVRIILAQFMKPFVKSVKNDTVDAEAIAEAITRPCMRFVAIKRSDQFDIQVLHRMRDRLVSSRILVSEMRPFLLEYGIALCNGADLFRGNCPRSLRTMPTSSRSQCERCSKRTRLRIGWTEACPSQELALHVLRRFDFVRCLDFSSRTER